MSTESEQALEREACRLRLRGQGRTYPVAETFSRRLRHRRVITDITRYVVATFSLFL